MADTYTAWNGEQYPWPPPTDWYEASDGRWWAPNTGPGPAAPHTGRSSDAPTPRTGSAELSGAQPTTAYSNQPFSQAPSESRNEPFNQGRGGRINQPIGRPQTQSYQPTNQRPFDHPGPGSGPQQGRPAPKKKSAARWVIGILVLLVLLSGGIAGAYFLTRESGITADPTTPTEGSTTTVTPTTTAVETTTTTVEETTTTVDPATVRGDYAEYLTGEGVVGFDDQILDDLGSDNCAAAGEAEASAGWNQHVEDTVTFFRQNQAEDPPEGGEPLTEDQIRAITNGAIVFYCPAEAARLGVEV